MKKYIKLVKSIAAFAVILSVCGKCVGLNFGGVTVYASTSSPKGLPTLTVKEALGFANSGSSALKTIAENEVSLTKTGNDLRNSLSSTRDTDTMVNLTAQIMQNDVKLSNNVKNKELTTRKLEISVLKAFASVISAENALKLYDLSLENDKRELALTKVKSSFELVSESAYLMATNNYEKKVKDRVAKVTAIDSAYITLNSTIGRDIKTRYNLVLDLEYEDFIGFSLTAAIYYAQNNSLDIKTKESDVAVAQYKLERYVPDYTASTQDINAAKTAYETTLAQAQRSLADAHNSIEKTITTAYNDFVKLEASYVQNNIEYKTMLKNLEINKTKYELGKITELEYLKYEYTVKQMEETIRAQIVDHEIQALQLEDSLLLV